MSLALAIGAYAVAALWLSCTVGHALRGISRLQSKLACTACNGSGSGMFGHPDGGSVCAVCDGTGVDPYGDEEVEA